MNEKWTPEQKLKAAEHIFQQYDRIRQIQKNIGDEVKNLDPDTEGFVLTELMGGIIRRLVQLGIEEDRGGR